MKITAAVVPARSAPFEIEMLELAAPLADEALVRIMASGMWPHRSACPRWLFPEPALSGRLRP